jgi:predicted outer membrane repeat protein
MSLTRWLSNQLGLSQWPASRRQTPTARPTFRPKLEALEDRWLPSTLTVTKTLDSGAGSLRAVIAAARGGDTIVFAPSLDGQTITLTSGELLIKKNLTITGPGAGQLTISGSNASRVFELSSKTQPQVTLSGLTISSGYGGGILNNSGDTLTVSNCILSGNTGAGIHNDGTLTVTGSTLSGNSSNSDGGGIYNDGPTLTVTNCTLSNNTAIGNVGGGIYTSGYFVAGAFKGGIATISSSTLTRNFAGWGGGIVVDFGGTAELDDCKLNSNTSRAHGGAVWIGSGTLTLSSCTVSNNSSNYGGGIYVSGGTVVLSGCTVTSNSAALAGGGIYVASGITVTVTDTSSITENTAEYGGGIFIDTNGTVTVENSSSITGNSAPSGYVADDVYNLGALDVDSSSWNLIGTVDGNQKIPI